MPLSFLSAGKTIMLEFGELALCWAKAVRIYASGSQRLN
jgi:hypothetical protein